MHKYLLAIFLFSLFGSVAELFLLEHTEGFWQQVPIILMPVSLVVLVWYYLDDRKLSRRSFQLVMGLFIISGFAGIGLHYNGNLEFELEMYPSMEGWELIWKTLKGATPVLAPGMMTALGLLGLLYTLKDHDIEINPNPN
ncbi:MAG: hypothetical protein R8P61_32855 [Bacteroidia bacterium]|nr:hypothetical protein [Bacteroidia bacterium]